MAAGFGDVAGAAMNSRSNSGTKSEVRAPSFCDKMIDASICVLSRIENIQMAIPATDVHALALHRIRDTGCSDAFVALFACQTAHVIFVPAARFLRPGFETLASRTPTKGWRSAERRTGARTPVGLHVTRQARRLRGALRPITRDARLPALSPWRFWAPVPRFPHQTCVRIGHSELLASGS